MTEPSLNPLVELTLMRFREFWREPEALFWTFAFPILMAVALGIAFRNRPPEVIKTASVTAQLAHALREEKQLDVQQLPAPAALDALRAGKVALVAEPGSQGAVIYHYDDTNPDARAARLLADAAVQRAAGRTNPVAARDQILREPGSRYIDFLIPGLLGLTIMSNAVWLTSFAIVDARRKKLMKRLVATPMPALLFALVPALAPGSPGL
jgi:glycine/D-amino acid oxidase-like deaminating enzyme